MNQANLKSDLHAKFATILPRIERHARCYFRHVRCPHRKADLIAETVAVAWRWFVRLAERGRDAARWPAAFATLAARHVRSGRRVCGQLKAKDTMNEAAQQRHGFTVSKLPDYSTLETNPLQEALTDNTQTPPPDAAAFRLDFPEWLDRHSDRDRSILIDMAQGERTQDLADRYHLSQPRISQIRREASDSWDAFCAA